MKARESVFSVVLPITVFILVSLLRFAAEAINNYGHGIFATVLLVVIMIFSALSVFFIYTFSVFAVYDGKPIYSAISVCLSALGASLLNCIQFGYCDFYDSILPIVSIAAVSFLIPYILRFLMQNRAVIFTVSSILLVFLNIIMLNELDGIGDNAVGCIFPNLRIESDIGLDDGVLAYILFVAVFAVDYLIMRKLKKSKIILRN